MVKAGPASPLEVIEADLLLQLLVVPLDAPAQLCEVDEALHRGVRPDGREPELRRLRLALRPLVHEPLLVSGRRSVHVPMRCAHADGTETRALPALAPLTPGQDPARADTERGGQVVDGQGLLRASLVSLAQRSACARRARPRRRDRSCVGGPYGDRSRDRHDVLESTLRESFTERSDLAVTAIGEYHSVPNAPSLGVIELSEGDPPLRLELHLLRHTGLLSPLRVARPALRQVEPHANAHAGARARQVQAHCHLASERASACIGMRLYLPESWASNTKRREKAGVPEEVQFEPKWKISDRKS